MANNIDSQVDEILEKCVLSTPRKSFFLFAGAGSGKTHSLVILLKKIRDNIGRTLLLQGKKVAVITYTNAATAEIINRLDYSPFFHISTIHSFVWEIIKHYPKDIKRLYCAYIENDIKDLEQKLGGIKNKASKTYISNFNKLQSLKERFEKSQKISRFIYSPTGSNSEHNALKHAEVIKISAQMIMDYKQLQQIIAQTYPILLIDESRDTKKL
jgi:ATP-dependent DNA helicase, uvrD/REP family